MALIVTTNSSSQLKALKFTDYSQRQNAAWFGKLVSHLFQLIDGSLFHYLYAFRGILARPAETFLRLLN